MIRIKNQTGFTLVEVMTASFLASALAVLMFGLTIFLYADQLRVSARSNMILDSQLFLRRLVDDIRVAGEVRSSNQLADVNAPSGGWITSDPANIIVLTFPAVDSSGDFIVNNTTGEIYQNEIVYFGEGATMYRRVIADTSVTGNSAITTCPPAIATGSCPPDRIMSENLQNLLFTFFDIDDNVTTVINDTRAVELTVNLSRQIYGEDVDTSVSTKATMRNAQ